MASQSSRERNLNDVIGNLMAARSENTLSQSHQKHLENMPSSSRELDNELRFKTHYTDDQLAMASFDRVVYEGSNSDNEEKDDTKPLDLTVHKQEPAVSPDSAIVEDIQSKGHGSLPIYTVALNTAVPSNITHLTTAPKPAESYVINLEHSPDYNSPLDSPLLKPLQMFSSPQGQHKMDMYKTLLAAGEDNTFVPTQGNYLQKTTAMTTDKSLSSAKGFPNISVLDCPPPYSETASPILSSKQISSMVSQSSIQVLKDNKEGYQNESANPAISFLRMATGEEGATFIHENVNIQQSDDKSQHKILVQDHLPQHKESLQFPHHQPPSTDPKTLQQHFLKQHIQLTPLPLAQPLSTQTIKSCSDLPEAAAVSHETSTYTVKDSHMNEDDNPTELPYPNFLLDPTMLTTSGSSTAPSNPSVLTSTPTAPMPMQAFFMTATSDGGVGNMVAIPVLHALPEGIAGLQPIAFAPHPVPVPPSSLMSQSGSVPSSVDALPSVTPVQNSNLDVGEPQKETSTSLSSEALKMKTATTTCQDVSKSKPGRPRGGGGKSHSKKAQKKDIKLVTENNIFPGVYTSILKLPWSRRSRNKPKTNSASERKKDAQIIAHNKINEIDTDSTTCKRQSVDAIPNKDHGVLVKQEFKDDISDKILHSPSHSQITIEQQQQHNFQTHLLQQHLRPEQEQQQVLHIPSKHSEIPSSSSPFHDLKYQFQQQQQHQTPIQDQRQKDLEQQQRLYAQYHQRLQEEQRKLKEQIEQSFVVSSTGMVNPNVDPVAASPLLLDQKSAQSSPLSQAMGPGMIITSSSALTRSETLPHKPLTNYEQSGPVFGELTVSPKGHRKRGRPPKFPNIYNQDETMAPAENAFPVSQPSFITTEPENFLNTNILNQESYRFPRNLQNNVESSIHSPIKGDNLSTIQNNDQSNIKFNDKMNLETKISLLTKQIGEEISRSVPSTGQCNNDNVAKMQQDSLHNDDTVNIDSMNQPVSEHEQALTMVKPRRKKVSRLLKSNENFMYATFKIKPKGGLTPKKTKRKRKDGLTTTAAAAETIANLKKKKLHDASVNSSETDDKIPSMVAWKFHEQYPREGDLDETTLGEKYFCVTCGNIYTRSNDNEEETVSDQCKACLLGLGVSSSSATGGNFSFSTIGSGKVAYAPSSGVEFRAECCITCGNIFQKHYSDTNARCETCRNSTPKAIKSSRLFSLHDSPSHLVSSSSASFYTDSAITSQLPKLPAAISSGGKTKGKLNSKGHLFCGTCREGFSKICDYLKHIRETHETKSEDDAQMFSSSLSLEDNTVPKLKISKTKKSLAHKTLTCPVEDCPHFFREQKDLDLHVSAKHSDLTQNANTDTRNSSVLIPSSEGFTDSIHHSDSTMTDMFSTGLSVNKEGEEGISQVDNDRPSLPPSSLVSEKPLQCDFCDFRCRQKNALTWHLRKHPEAVSQHGRYSNVSSN